MQLCSVRAACALAAEELDATDGLHARSTNTDLAMRTSINLTVLIARARDIPSLLIISSNEADESVVLL